LRLLPEPQARSLLESMSPNATLTLLGQCDEAERARLLALLSESLQKGLQELMDYPSDSAARLMETRIGVFRPGMSVAQALDRLRQSKLRGLHSLFLVDDDNRLAARVAIHDLAIADLEQTLREIAAPASVVVQATAPREEVVDILERSGLPNIPVVDLDGHLVGVVRYASLVKALEEAASDAVQTMVGASKDERALSPATFAVRKRQLWLQINLLTAFLAAAVVGLFESTIAQVTALAVLLPVVAGQSGNAGAQALAVTMRGLALREISVRQWRSVTIKELKVGVMNGLAIALTCGIGVLIWSGSLGLVLVIVMSMILAMIAAGFAGAIVPIVLKRLGQDPAQSSSIVLTTITDIAGFFSFLGIATLLIRML
jgi:magnesium transporter